MTPIVINRNEIARAKFCDLSCGEMFYFPCNESRHLSIKLSSTTYFTFSIGMCDIRDSNVVILQVRKATITVEV
jgi:hypothetical protein